VSESVKELEGKLLKEVPGSMCRLTFWTNIGVYYFNPADIAEIELDKLKAYVEALEDVYNKVKGHDAYSTILDVALNQLIGMGKTLINAKEGRLDWYLGCLRKLLDELAKKG